MNIKRQIFEFLVSCQAELPRAPTRNDVREMFCGLTDDADLHLEQLQREGLIRVGPGAGAAVSLVPTFSVAPRIWLRDSVPPDHPEAARATCRGSLALDLRGLGLPAGQELYAMEVLDDSMRDAGIERGDIAVLSNVRPVRGDVAAFEIDGCTVLRRYLVIQDVPHALAENAAGPDLRAAFDLPAHGVLWGLIRTYAGKRRDGGSSAKRRISCVGLYANRADEPPVVERVSSTPWDETDSSLPTTGNGTQRRVPVRKQRPAKPGSRAKAAGKRASKSLPKPPPRIGLNEGNSTVYG